MKSSDTASANPSQPSSQPEPDPRVCVRMMVITGTACLWCAILVLGSLGALLARHGAAKVIPLLCVGGFTYVGVGAWRCLRQVMATRSEAVQGQDMRLYDKGMRLPPERAQRLGIAMAAIRRDWRQVLLSGGGIFVLAGLLALLLNH
ncbi:hypothetical protein E3E12_06610 [Formicincola oecophyllae]|uniref:DUF3899 domain-containing protein n=1 Tax=Formicincola oecophyllae TaxID=2558361 RepID=A0A4Y6U8X6_9PROT|nr:hypothetical protein [Formicincola oecophyllae]QDH13909.1 hypothetical protein E3E12_06610 [Formicincola oecophyllae]